MSKLSNLSDKDIYGLIDAMQNGIAVKPIGEEAEALKTSISRAYAELERRAQKKSDPQPTGNTGQPEQQKKQPDPELLRMMQNAVEVRPKTAAERMENEGWQKIEQALTNIPQVAPKPTIVIHFAGKPLAGQYTRGELRDVARQNFTLVVKSATFQRCLKAGDFSELWTLRLYYNLHLAVQGLKKLEGLEAYTMEDLFIGYWNYHKDKQEAGRALAEYLKQPKPE